MNTRVWITVVVVLLLAIVVFAGFVWLAGSSQTATSTPTGGGNPFGTSSSTTTGGPSITVPTKDGGSVTVPDFTQSAPSVAEGSERYYSLTNNQQAQGANAEYDIQYGTDGSITIALLSEPISKARLDAETKLRSFFPLSNEQLCSLDVIVGVPYGVNQTFSGSNLGLSFCPGSTQLPQ